jgi:hypothetical protein
LYPSALSICSCRTLQILKKQIDFQSTDSSVTNKNRKSNIPVEHPILDTRFDEYRLAYRYRRSIELLRGYLVYRLFSIDFLVNNQVKVR